jgi:hypothetical protein
MIIAVMLYAVIIDKQEVEKSIITQMQRDAEHFVKEIKNNEMNLHVKFNWINGYIDAINNNCTPYVSTVTVIRYCGYLFAIYNTIMMHFILAGKLPVTIMSLMPLSLSLIGGLIPSTHIIFFGVIEATQVLVGFTIISVGFFNLVSARGAHEKNQRSLTD